MADTALKNTPAIVQKEDDSVTIKIKLSGAQADGQFISLFDRMCQQVNNLANQNGFWEDFDENDPVKTALLESQKLLLVHAEISEAAEALRKGNPMDEKCPEFTNAETEMADAVIRLMDLSRQRKYRLGEAILAKHKYNATRPYKHGKRF